MSEILTLKQISKKLNIDESTLRTYLAGFRFSKYIRDYYILSYECCNGFWCDFMEFLKIKKNYKYLKNVKSYVDSLPQKE